MLHLTINTGHVRQSPRSEVGSDILPQLERLLVDGEHKMPGPPGYTLITDRMEGGLVATIWQGQRSCLTITVASNEEAAEHLWDNLEQTYLRLSDIPGFRSADWSAPKRPESTPWCVNMLSFATPSEARWMADFSRCLAWAWLDLLGYE